MAPTDHPYTFLMIGVGWRSPYYLNLPPKFPDRLRCSGIVVRTPQRAEEAAAKWHLPTYLSVDDALAAERPDFVVVAVTWPQTPIMIRYITALGVPVLTETPPAPTVPELHELWADVGHLDLVQVAEQYHLYPFHQARRAIIDSGRVGQVREARLSSSHQYHMTSLLRWYLGVGFEAATVTGLEWTNPLIDTIAASGYRDDPTEQPIRTNLGHFQFASGKVGQYDFTDGQWWNNLRPDLNLLRGSKGEIRDTTVTAFHDVRTTTTGQLERWQTGLEMQLEGFDLSHVSYGDQVVYRNPWFGGRLSDDEIAVAEIVATTGAWARAGAGPNGPYPLADGCQDHALALAIDDSIAAGHPVVLEEQPWAGQVSCLARP
ncbi:MAG: Gfo/Idh/MocA family oxidoreductase [Bifidobacteriaceae bacterium]|jgi:predicted dehydrogenase|nr:Gfo/Idh/MocA family oxidoreductase [Bifidobacteriaceae bacterium]